MDAEVIASGNPLTHMVYALRMLMFPGYAAESPLLWTLPQLGWTLGVLAAIGARLYPRLAR